jgi:L-amino acid N-acyltransferase YncA
MVLVTRESPTIRVGTPDDAPGIARVHVQSWRETYTGIVPQAFLDGLTEARTTANWERTFGAGNPVFVAAVDEEIVGFTSGGATRFEGYDAEVSTLYLLKSAHGQGTGRALFTAMLEALRERGARSVIVWVLADNPTCGFYARMGGVKTVEQTIEIGGANLLEYGYLYTLENP